MCDNRRAEKLGVNLDEYPVDYSVIEWNNMDLTKKTLYHIGVYNNSSGCAHWIQSNGDGTFINLTFKDREREEKHGTS